MLLANVLLMMLGWWYSHYFGTVGLIALRMSFYCCVVVILDQLLGGAATVGVSGSVIG